MVLIAFECFLQQRQHLRGVAGRIGLREAIKHLGIIGEVLQAFKIESFPTYIVLDKDGVMRFRQSGFGEGTAAELSDAINKALKRASDPNLAAVFTIRDGPRLGALFVGLFPGRLSRRSTYRGSGLG